MSDTPEADEAAEAADASDAPDGQAGSAADAAGGGDGSGGAEESEESEESEELAALRREVEQKYDFDNFSPQDMAQMSSEEWEAAFDPGTWITGEELLDRVEADLKGRVADRDVFARIERFDDLLIAYSDNGYAAVYPDGSVEGSGTVLRDVKPTVALCSMDSYEPPDPPADEALPTPQEIPDSSDALGNTVLQVVAGAQVLAGLALLAAWLLYGLGILSQPGAGTGALNLWLLVVAGLGFLVIGIVLFAVVANARLSDKYRAEEFRNRLRAVGLEDGERPAFLDEITGLDGELPEELAAAGEAGEGDGDERRQTDGASGDRPDRPEGP
jgi:hypothetical protein